MYNTNRSTLPINNSRRRNTAGQGQFMNSSRGNNSAQQHPNLNVRGDGERVIRSEVWNCFDLDGLMAICRACNERLKVGPTRQTSSLWRHLKRHSREVQSQLLLPRSIQPPFRSFDRTMTTGIGMNSGGLNSSNYQQSTYQRVEAILAGHGHPHSRDPREYCNNNAYGNINNNSSSQESVDQHYYGVNGGAGFMLQTAATISATAAEIGSSSSVMDLLNGAASQPMVTVDCKAVESLDLNQLLGIGLAAKKSPCTDQLENGGGVNSGNHMMDIGDDEDEEESEKRADEPDERQSTQAINRIVTTIADREEVTAVNLFQTALVEFLLENALPFHRILHQSPTFHRLLRLYAPSNTTSLQQFQQPLPSTEFLLNQIVPKMFERALAERKAQFEEDFFVLVLRRTRVETAIKEKGTWILRISAVKLGSGFGLCSRCIGVFAFKGGLGRMREALQRCFEFGQVQLKLWQVSAVVHDGTGDFVELCRQLDLPSIPSTHSLLRNIYAELDNLEFSKDCVRRVKIRFEKAIGNCLDGSHFSAFSIVVPKLITRVDAFFRQQLDVDKTKQQQQSPENKVEEEFVLPAVTPEQRLLNKFRTLWTFQRERLLADQVAWMSIFLNPSACRQQNDDPFSSEQWAKIEANVVEEICQACLLNGTSGEKMSESELFERRTDIEDEVNNFVDAAICECRRTTPAATTSMIGGDSKDEKDGTKGNMPTKAEDCEMNTIQPEYSLSELLLWWSVNMERFPRVCHLARQFCAIPLSDEIGNDWRRTMELGGGGHKDMDSQNASYAAELLNKDLLLNECSEDGMYTELTTLSHLLTVRMAVLEKNGCALPPE